MLGKCGLRCSKSWWLLKENDTFSPLELLSQIYRLSGLKRRKSLKLKVRDQILQS